MQALQSVKSVKKLLCSTESSTCRATVSMSAVSLIVLAVGCTANQRTVDPPMENYEIGGSDQLHAGEEPPSSITQIVKDVSRIARGGTPDHSSRRGLREVALSLGSQHGYRRRTWEIKQRLEDRSQELSSVYDFNRVAVEAPERTGFLLPPVVARTLNAFESNADGQELAAADQYFELIKPAILLPAVPTWREYLLFDAEEPMRIPAAHRPKNTKDWQLFERWMQEGWQAGLNQATIELTHRMSRLRQDFEGMLEFRRLEALGMIDAPVAFGVHHGVSGDSHSMRVGDRSAALVTETRFITDASRWNVEHVPKRHQSEIASDEGRAGKTGD